MIVANDAYVCANESKANFEDIYNAPDPRAYYTTLDALDYRIPTNAKPVFRAIMNAMGGGRVSKVVDVGCSYGVNAAMLRYDLTFEELARRYRQKESQRQSIASSVIRDAELYADLKPYDDASYVGLDIAEQAVGYADAVGLIDEGLVENLEDEGISEPAAAALAETDLVISTGAIGYVGEKTLGKIVGSAERAPWVAAFVLRPFPFDEIAERLSSFGLVTEKLSGATFLQRRFRDSNEREGALEAVRAAGRDPEGFESDGYYHAELFLARPAGEIVAPIDEMKLV